MLSDQAKKLRLKLSELFPLLNARQKRLVAAAEAKSLGRGGITMVSAVTGLTRKTIYEGWNDFGGCHL